jgi:hypothetical protein
MKTAVMMIALMTVASAAFASDRNYIAPQPQPANQASVAAAQASVQQDTSYADHRVHFVHYGK